MARKLVRCYCTGMVRPSWRWVAAASLLLAGALIALASRSPRDTKPNLVLITIDTLRADHLGCYGYFRKTSPNIDRFARDALLFDRAIAPMASTLPSHV